ncbi:MAG: hypothetical protein P4L46_06830 [Fimbriimonas sp.]|nr:hypothetical protein [Fimbriimonas sp.]
MLRFFSPVLLSIVAASVFAAPTVLIVQTRVPFKNNVDINVTVADYVAQEFDNDGRLVPIVYSMTDPAFRAALQSGKVKESEGKFTVNEGFVTAERLGAEYLFLIEASQAGKSVKTRARLYHSRREVWKYDDNVSVRSLEVINEDSTCRSIARTILFRLNGGPLKGMASRKKTYTPEMTKGQEPVAPAAPPVETTVSSNGQLKNVIDGLIADGKRAVAIATMRDAVDSAPFDLDRREELVNLLMADNPAAAGEEARRAASLLPDKVELRALAARAWMQAGKPDEAQRDLNEAIARDPNGQGTRMLLAELSIGQLEPQKAMDHLDQAIKDKDSCRARFLRATCRAMLGGVDSMQADLAEAAKLGPPLTPGETMERYVLVTNICDRMLERDGVDLRSLMQEVVVKPQDKDLKATLANMARLLQGRIALLSAVEAPADSKLSNEKRLLANRLLAQCLFGLQTFSDKGDEDALADARISLGESLKQLAAAKKKSGESVQK